MLRTSLVRIVHFRATHAYGLPGRSLADNTALFGELVRPHPHDFRVEVRVEGPADPETGFVVDLPALDALLHANVVEPLDGAHLNDAVPDFREGRVQPSTEALAAYLARALAGRIPPGARLASVRVWESETLAGEARLDLDPPHEATP
jgi:6-pyruvoyltetrahydropterin/6-carboxytetrahydropterin synthase